MNARDAQTAIEFDGLVTFAVEARRAHALGRREACLDAFAWVRDAVTSLETLLADPYADATAQDEAELRAEANGGRV